MNKSTLLSLCLPLIIVTASGCAASNTSQSSEVVRLCDSAGCRMIDPNVPSGKVMSSATQTAKMKVNAYRGEKLSDLEAELGQGNAIAGYKLGSVYEKGLAGVSPDIRKATQYYEKSAELGDAASARAVALILLGAASTDRPSAAPTDTLDGGPDVLMPSNNVGVSSSQHQRALDYLYKAADGGDALGMLELGRQLYSGGFVERDPVAAGNLFELAAKEGVPEAKYYLGQMHFRGVGRQQNGYQAIKWTREAATSGNVLAQRALGQLYINGYESVGRDPGEAQRWLSAAAQNGDPESAKLLELLQSGRYVPGGGSFTTLMSAGDIVKASQAAMRGIDAARRRLDQGGTLSDPVVIDWGETTQPNSNPNGGQTSVIPASAGANCFIIEHSARVEGKTQERSEKVCESESGGYTVAI